MNIRVYQGIKISRVLLQKYIVNFFPTTTIVELTNPHCQDDHGTIAVAILEDGGFITTSNDYKIHTVLFADGMNDEDMTMVYIKNQKCIKLVFFNHRSHFLMMQLINMKSL